MNYGLYLSASGVLTNMYRQDVFANNLANVKTVGFKPDLPTIRQRAPESMEDQLDFGVRKQLLDRLGGGVLAGQQRIEQTQGELTRTGNALDVALTQPKMFFAVAQADAATGQTAIHLSRDGRFGLNAEGELIQVASGHRVLDTSDRPITLKPGVPATIDDAGRIMQDGASVGRLQVVSVADPDHLVKQGDNLLRMPDGTDTRQPVESPRLRSGYEEASAVDPIRTLMQVIEATKAVSANGNMIRYHDLVMDKAVNVLGRVIG